jgi:hypothetical protein
LYCWRGSLSEIISVSPEWWTPTAQPKAIVGFVLGLRFAHSLGMLHGHLTVDNVLFNENRVIQITHFYLNRLMKLEWNSSGMVDIGGFFRECCMPTSDVRAFAEVSFRNHNGWFRSERREPSGRSWIYCGDN